MASTAISAQGSVVSIGTGAGSAKTITAIALGNPTILTAASHGFVNGDVVTIAGLTGANAATINGQTWSVRNITTNTFALYVDSTGLTITAAGTATPVTFAAIVNCKSFSGFVGSASEIDVTNLDSTAKEFRLGLVDSGNLTLELDYKSTETSHIALRTKQVSGVLTNFKLVLPDATSITFNAFVKKFSLSGGVDEVAKASVDLRITGAVTGL